MHICFASLDYPSSNGGGGVGTYVRAAGRELVRRGHRVSVVALGSEEEHVTYDEGIRVVWIHSGNLHWYASQIPVMGRVLSLPIREIEYSMAVFNAIREIDAIDPIDIVEGTETGSYYLPKLRSGIKNVIRIHGEMFTFKRYTPSGHISTGVRLSRYLQRRALRRCDLMTSPSHAHAAEIVEELKRRVIPPKVVPNPIAKGTPAVRVNAGNKDRPVFLYVGRLQRVKGVIPLLKAIPAVVKQIPEARFVFVGSRHPSLPWDEIQGMVRRLGIEKSVSFPGHVEYSSLMALYREAAAVVLPSFYETFGYVLLEALINGTPVVASDIGSIREVAAGRRGVLFVPPGDIHALADACVRIVLDTERTERTDDFAEFNVATVSEKLLHIYRGLKGAESQDNVINNIFLSPHFDDAVFSCGGIMCRYHKQGRSNVVVTLFGGLPDNSDLSPFASEIHHKWKVADPVRLRMSEDREVLATIGAKQLHLEFLDCIYRRTEGGTPLYNDYESIKGTVHPMDRRLCDNVHEKVAEILKGYDPGRTQIFVPLGVGNHVDHQIAREVGERLITCGYRIFFYEEFPYCMWHPEEPEKIGKGRKGELSPLVVHIEIEAKLKMIRRYQSQLSGIGGTYGKVRKNFSEYALAVGKGTYAERIWEPGVDAEQTGSFSLGGEMQCLRPSGSH